MNPRSSKPSETATVIPDMPAQTWGIESCGAGALSTVLQHYGDAKTMQEWDASLPKTHGGVMTVDMLIAARQQGYEAQLVTGNRALVEEELLAGRPVILMLQVIFGPGKTLDFFHYIVADGIDPQRGLIRTQFGDGHLRWVPVEKLEKTWSGGGHTAILIHPRTLNEALRAAVALEDEGKVADAAAQYRALSKSHADSPLVWTNYGNAEMQLGANEEAERAFRKALQLDPESRDAMNNLAWLLYQQKRLDEAETLARKAASEPGPDVYLVLDTLARVLAAKGSCGEAMRTFREALDAVPQSRASARAGIESGMADAQRTCS
jgi:tetratricopeptide (TPR) repeat protein